MCRTNGRRCDGKRSPVVTAALREKGDAESIALADHLDAEREAYNAHKRVRRHARKIEENKEEYERAIYDAFYDSELNGVGRYSSHFSGHVFQDFKIGGEGTRGRVRAVFTYDDVWDYEGEANMFAVDGLIDINDFSNPDTLDADLESMAEEASWAVADQELSQDKYEDHDRALKELLGDDYEEFVDVDVQINSHADADKVRNFYEGEINNLEVEDLTDEDLKTLSSHPLASDKKKAEALEELAAR